MDQPHVWHNYDHPEHGEGRTASSSLSFKMNADGTRLVSLCSRDANIVVALQCDIVFMLKCVRAMLLTELYLAVITDSMQLMLPKILVCSQSKYACVCPKTFAKLII